MFCEAGYLEDGLPFLLPFYYKLQDNLLGKIPHTVRVFSNYKRELLELSWV